MGHKFSQGDDTLAPGCGSCMCCRKLIGGASSLNFSSIQSYFFSNFVNLKTTSGNIGVMLMKARIVMTSRMEDPLRLVNQVIS